MKSNFVSFFFFLDNLWLGCSKTYEEWLEEARRVLPEDVYRTWFVRMENIDLQKYDKYTPGLFKLEKTCHKFLAISAKAYLALDKFSNTVKFALRGTQRRPVNRGVFSAATFETVLARQQSIGKRSIAKSTYRGSQKLSFEVSSTTSKAIAC